MTKDTERQIARVIEGVVQLCLGKAGCVVWVDQADAAAFCDGTRIYLPKPTGEHEEEYPLILAMAMREVAKLKHTSTSAFAAGSEEGGLFSAMLEDVRVKRLLGMEFLGTPPTFRRAFEISTSIFQRRAAAGELAEGVSTQLAIWHAANSALDPSRIGTPDAGSFGQLGARECEPERLAEILRMASTGPTLDSTVQALAVGRAIFEALRKPDDEPPPPQGEGEEAPQPNDQNAQEGGDQGATDGEGCIQDGCGAEEKCDGDVAAGDQSSQGDEQDQSEARDGDTGPQQAAQDQATEAGPEQQGSEGVAQGADLLSHALAALRGFQEAVMPPTPGLTEGGGATLTDQELGQIAQALASSGDQLIQLIQPGGEDSALGMCAAEEDEFEHPLVDLDALMTSFDDGAGGGLAAEEGDEDRALSGVPGRLVGVLQRELHEQRRRPSRLASTGHRVDASRLWRLKRLGETNVFRRRAHAPGIDAAVEILLDRSGSMHKQMGEATNVTYALALALQRITGVQTSVDVFPGSGGSSENVLAFKESAHRANHRLSTIKASGGTPMGAALSMVLPKLLQARCVKRLLFVITDGMPDAGHLVLTREKIAQAISQEVTVVGIGLGAEAKVETLFPHHIKVGAIADLPQELERLFKSSLLGWIEA